MNVSHRSPLIALLVVLLLAFAGVAAAEETALGADGLVYTGRVGK